MLCMFESSHLMLNVPLLLSFICSLWQLLKADNSHVATVAVPLLIHCLAQPTGANVFWELVENDFNNEDWKVRFSAGQCRFLIHCVSEKGGVEI